MGSANARRVGVAELSSKIEHPFDGTTFGIAAAWFDEMGVHTMLVCKRSLRQWDQSDRRKERRDRGCEGGSGKNI